MGKNIDYILTRIFMFLNIYGLKYVSTIFLSLTLICAIIIIDMGYTAALGSPIITHILIDYMEVKFTSNAKGEINMPIGEIFGKFGLIILIAEIIIESVKSIAKKHWNTLRRKQDARVKQGFLYRIGVEIRLITLIFAGSVVLVSIGYKSRIPLLIEILVLVFLYVFSLIFIKIYKSFDKTADSIVYPGYKK